MSFVTKTDVLNYLQIDTNAYIDAGFSTWLSAIETFIERYTGKNFEQDTAQTRYFDGNGKRMLYLTNEDDLVSVTSLRILNEDGTVIESLSEGAANDFLLYPLNTTPKYEIRLTTYASVGAFYRGNKTVEITGTWGNSATVPADIKLATMIMLGEIIRQGQAGGNVSSVSLGDYSVSYKSGNLESIASQSGAVEILKQYKEWEL